jgi:adenosylcobyric acid synthase
VRLPRVANFDDFEWLADEAGVRVRWVTSPAALADADLVIVPGSKSTVRDLAWLRERGLAEAVIARARAGGAVLGVCGGYQMLGQALHDPAGVESASRSTSGLGLLSVETTFDPVKTTRRIRARPVAAAGPFADAGGVVCEAYEIHAGVTRVTAADAVRPFAVVARGGVPTDDLEGASDATGTVTGTYLHGLFASGAVRRSLLTWLAARAGRAADPGWGEGRSRAARWDRLADIVTASLDLPAIGRLVGMRAEAF